jgi:hypothetical protein
MRRRCGVLKHARLQRSGREGAAAGAARRGVGSICCRCKKEFGLRQACEIPRVQSVPMSTRMA